MKVRIPPPQQSPLPRSQQEAAYARPDSVVVAQSEACVFLAAVQHDAPSRQIFASGKYSLN
jgi:hypothetical protein